MSSDDLECKGCLSYGKEIFQPFYCSLKIKCKELECPCFACLVKMVCINEKHCKKIIDYANYTVKNS